MRTGFKKGYIPWNKGKMNICSEETRKKMSEAQKGKHHSEETKEKIRIAMTGMFIGEKHPMFGKFGKKHPRFGKHHSKETREKLRRARLGKKSSFLGRHHTEEAKEKMRKSSIGILAGEKHPMFGKHLSEEAKKKISISASKRIGAKNPFYGKHHTKETKKKLSETITGMFLGSKNHNWKGGVSNEPYPFNFNKELKELIRKRDNYICQKCHIPQRELLRKLDVHHIDYNKENLNPKNLISLCRRCNLEVNFNRKYWIRYFMEKIDARGS